MISVPLAAIFSTAVFSTSFISGVFGMAGGLILLGILAALMPLPAAMVLHGITQSASNGWRAWLWRTQIRWGIAAKYAVGTLAATGIITLLAFSPSTPVVLVTLGLLSLAGLAVPARLAPDIRHAGQAFLCGALCGSLQLLTGVSGPVLDVFFARSDLSRREVVATKAIVQFLGHALKVVYFGRLLAGDSSTVGPVAIVIAVSLAIVGTQLSRRTLDAISDRQFRNWTRWLIALVAFAYLAQGLIALL